MSINKYESAVRSCFGENQIQSIWYGGTEGKFGDDPNKMYMELIKKKDFKGTDWTFDFDKFGTLPLHLDEVINVSSDYDVFVIWMKVKGKEEYDFLSQFCEPVSF